MNLAKSADFRINSLALTDAAFERIVPPRSGHPLWGSLATTVRRTAWKLFGLYPAFERAHEQIAALRLELEIARQFQFRPATMDREIFHKVFLRNEYELPDSFQPDDIILDVGAHIGSFCYAVLHRGCRRVHAFEADADNYQSASANLRHFGDRVRLQHCAVWRSDRKGDSLFGDAASGCNTGGGSLLFNREGQPMEVVAFDDILRDVTEEGRRRIRLLKIDCEGAEYPILMTSSLLHLIDEIRGEYHEINDGVHNNQPIPAIARIAGVERFNMSVLSEALERSGFCVRSTHAGDMALGHFIATRRS